MNCSYEDAEVAIQALRESRERNGGQLSPHKFSEFLEFTGVGWCTGYRWLRTGVPSGNRISYELNERAKEILVQVHGNRSLAYRMLKDEGEDLPTSRTFRNAVARTFDPVQLAAISRGELGLVEMRMYSEGDATVRNELWICDTVLLDLLAVQRPGSKTHRRVYVTLIIDDSTGAIMGWSMSFNDTKASVLVAMRDAMVIRPDAGPFGGIPKIMNVDQGPNMISNAVRESSVLAGFTVKVLEGAAPWLKGKVEATVKATNKDFAARSSHYLAGRKDRRGRPQMSSEEPPSLDELRYAFAKWVRLRNETHPLGRNEDRSPLECWNDQDDVPIRPISRRAAAALLKERKRRKIGKQGISLDGVKYVSTEMPRHRGKSVVVAYMPRDPRTVDVFIDGKWKFVARPLNTLSPAEITAFRNACHEAVKVARRTVSKYRKASKPQIAPITGGGEAVEDTGVIPVEKAREIRRATLHAAAKEASRARNDLSGSNVHRNKPIQIEDEE